MAKSLQQQITDQIQGCATALLVIPQEPSVDTIASALTLADYLKSLKKDVTIISDNFTKLEKLSFLSNLDSIQSDFKKQNKCIIELDTKQFPVSDLKYETKDDKLQIILTPKDKDVNIDAFKIIDTKRAIDLIITINTVELPTLGSTYTTNKELFDATPIINIDHRPENEHYGQINWIDINATSTSEMLLSFLYNEKPPEKEIATTLLAGMMDETHSFRSKQVNSNTLKAVSRLLEYGAEHEIVVNNLYRTKTVGLLKLWGHVLDNLQSDREHGLAWSIIPESVFSITGTDRSHLHDLMHEVLSHSPEAKTVVLFLEKNGEKPTVEVQVSTLPPLHAKDLIKNWQPVGSERFASAVLKNANLAQAEEHVIRLVKERLGMVLGLK